MKTTILWISLLITSLCCGCNTPVRTAYKTEKAAAITAEAAMQAWGDYVAQYHPGVEAERKVKSAFEKYQTAMIAAVDATRAFALASSAKNETDAAEAKRKTSAALSLSAQALTELVATIRSFGVWQKAPNDGHTWKEVR